MRETTVLEITNVRKTRGNHAVRWMRKHCFIAVYDERTLTLKAPVTKYGEPSTYALMHEALDSYTGVRT